MCVGNCDVAKLYWISGERYVHVIDEVPLIVASHLLSLDVDDLRAEVFGMRNLFCNALL